MSPQLVEFLLDAGNVVLGAALALSFTVAQDWRKDRKKVRAMKRAIRRELRETAHRLLALVHTLHGRHGTFSRELLQWMKPQIERYEGPNPRDGMLTGIAGILSQSDAEIAKVAAHLKTVTPPQYIPNEEPVYTATVVAGGHDLDPEYVARVLDILSHLRMLNDASENGRYFSRLTFTPGMSKETQERAEWNANQAEIAVANRARIVVDKIAALEDLYRT